MEKKEPSSEVTDEVTIEVEGWTQAPKLSDLKGDLESAKSDHDDRVSKIDAWLDNLHVRGKAKPKKVKGRSSVQPKLIRKQSEWRYTAMSEPFLSASDMFDTSPVTWEDVKSAEQNNLVLNNQFNTKINKVKFIDEYVRSACNKGTAIVRTGWINREEQVMEVQPVYEMRPNPEMEAVHAEIHQMMQENPTGYRFEVPEELQAAHEQTMATGIPFEAVVVGEQEVEVTKTIKNEPTVQICDYRNITVDPTCEGDIDKAKFVIYSFETSLSELREEGEIYQNLDELSETAAVNTTPLATPDHEVDENETTFEFKDDPRKKFVAQEYWGYWDFDGSGIAKPFVCTWAGNTMIRLEANPFPDQKLPFVFVPFMPEEDSVYGEPDGELLTDNQNVIGALTRGMLDCMGKAAVGQTGTRKDALDATNKRRYENGEDYQYNPHIDPRMAFFQHQYPEIPQSAPFLINYMNSDSESLTGVKSFNQGIQGNQLGDVVAGIKGALDAAAKRETGILRRLSKGLEDIGRKIIAMNQEFLDEEEVVRITNSEFVTVRRDDLAGEFDLRVDVTTAEEDAAKIDKLAFNLQTMGPKMPFEATKLIMAKIARLQKMPDLAHQLETFEPEPDPMEQAAMQEELRGKQLENALTEAKIQSELASAGLDEAKIEEVIAKARLLGSQADKSDLDFVEQESGVAQERELEKQGEQGRMNIALEQEKAKAKPESPLAVYKSKAKK